MEKKYGDIEGIFIEKMARLSNGMMVIKNGTFSFRHSLTLANTSILFFVNTCCSSLTLSRYHSFSLGTLEGKFIEKMVLLSKGVMV